VNVVRLGGMYATRSSGVADAHFANSSIVGVVATEHLAFASGIAVVASEIGGAIFALASVTDSFATA
jgi:hypothetical protein